MEENEDLLVKLIIGGQAINLYATEGVVTELVSHPKFVRMNDKNNAVFISIEDISAFEVLSFRTQESNETFTPQTQT